MNLTFRPCKMPTIFFENPHRGASGEPFMNKTTLLWFIKVRKRLSSSSDDSVSSFCGVEGRCEGASAGFWSVCERGRYVEFDACFARSWVKPTASAPSILPSSKCPYIWNTQHEQTAELKLWRTLKRINLGTDSMSKLSAISSCSSAST